MGQPLAMADFETPMGHRLRVGKRGQPTIHDYCEQYVEEVVAHIRPFPVRASQTMGDRIHLYLDLTGPKKADFTMR